MLTATNSWLHAQTRQSQYRYDKDRGYVCTLSALVIKSHHRAYLPRRRLRASTASRAARWSSSPRTIASGFRRSRAISAARSASIRRSRSTTAPCELEKGDVFVLATDGVHEHVGRAFVAEAIAERTPTTSTPPRARSSTRPTSAAARTTSPCRSCASTSCPTASAASSQQLDRAAAAAAARRRAWCFDGYRIVREMHASSRSHIYLAVGHARPATPVVLKTPVDRPARRPGAISSASCWRSGSRGASTARTC